LESPRSSASGAPGGPTAEVELARLESALRQLKIQYDMFLAGGLAREPFELRSEVEQLIRHYSHNPMRKYAQRFHFNALMSRFNSMCELWNKSVRSLEEGERRHATTTEPAVRERLVTRCRVGDAPDLVSMRRLHSRFVEARRRAGIESGAPSFETFMRGVEGQVQRLRRQAKCDQIELRLIVKDDKVLLKARPGR
jgi:hypothetical protein